MAEQFRRVARVGLGLKGGSLAMVLRKKWFAKEVVGIDIN
jgi:prephenate dehydrogenase